MQGNFYTVVACGKVLFSDPGLRTTIYVLSYDVILQVLEQLSFKSAFCA